MPQSSAKQQREYFESHQLIEIFSVETGTLYIDKDCRAFLFEDSAAAAAFTEENEGTSVGNPVDLEYDVYMWRVYCQGIKKLVLNGKDDDCIVIKRQRDVREYANPELSRNVLLLIETREPQYLTSLGERKFIVPALVTTIETRGIKKPRISFLVMKPGKQKARTEDPDVLYVAFSDLDNYSAWRGGVMEPYQPVEMEYWQFAQVFGESGVAIDPGVRSALYLMPENLSMIPAGKPKTGYFFNDKPDDKQDDSPTETKPTETRSAN